jgi:hypothetical protein
MNRHEFSMGRLQQTADRALAAKRITTALLLVICIVAAVFV